tara:strand:- start:187 stop:582 length:396 start_codon:yes stop_codon:yes gene_type:complete
MIKFFSNYRIFFYLINLLLIFLYLYPGSILGWIIYSDKRIQPQLTPDFIISSNHFYVFALLSIIGFLTFIKTKIMNYVIIYLLSLSIILEIFHLIIPQRSFQWSDLFGNLFGVIVIILLYILENKYEVFKK